MAAFVISLCFMSPEIIEKSLEQFYATRSEHLELQKHVLVDQHYPLNYPRVREKLLALCEKYELSYLDPGKNLGLHDGFNWACAQLPLKPGDIIIAYDPDSFPLGNGWDFALVRTIEGSGGDVVWASLLNPRSKGDIEAKGYSPRTIDGHISTWITNQAVVNSVCAWSWNWLSSVGGLQEPLAFYGLLECAMFEQLKGKKWAFLTQWSESDHLRDGHDRAYQVWKWRHAHLKDWPGDFKSFVEAGSPETGPAPAKLP